MIYLSHNYSIRSLLNLKDNNIFFLNNFVKDIIIKGVISKVFLAELTYSPAHCECCGSINNNSIIKYGFKNTLIKLPMISNYNTYIKLKKQRFLCKECGKTFTAKTSLVNKHCFISNQTKLAVANEAKLKISEKDIARRFNSSHNTVNRIVNSFYRYHLPNFNYLPKKLCFDEFKSVKECSGAMSFIFCDAESHKIIDIVEDRRLNKLRNYFSKYSQKARNSVTNIVIDMYSPYITLIKELFPKAKISIDRFHLVQLINRSFNKTRINIMNKFRKENPPIYNKLKKYWKLLLKDSSKLSYLRKHYHHSFRQYISEEEIVTKILSFSKELEEAYTIYQNLIFFVKTRNYIAFKRFIKSNLKFSSHHMLTSIKTYIKYLPYIKNSLTYPFSNGPIEGINNKIKVIKRIAFGYRSFYHLRNRILIYSNLTTIKIPST